MLKHNSRQIEKEHVLFKRIEQLQFILLQPYTASQCPLVTEALVGVRDQTELIELFLLL